MYYYCYFITILFSRSCCTCKHNYTKLNNHTIQNKQNLCETFVVRALIRSCYYDIMN